ncbi:hypothetical protein HYW21_07915 [Candidatus Woesearchaeota archaeon]|nr:hypothetical protein [Candidatus Woesearchaeota archaeon]
MKKVVAIVQARMGASRLPGKVLMPLLGKPLLLHILQRLQTVKRLNHIIVATTTSNEDNVLVEHLDSWNISYYRGSEDNVLDRFIRAAESTHADIVVRICADSPLIEPNEIDKMVEIILEKNADYVMVKSGVLCMHEGFEVVTLKALRHQLDFSDGSYVKEHVTAFIREHPEKFAIAYFVPEQEYQRKGFRLSIDTMQDFRFMEQIYKRLYNEGTIVDLKQVTQLLDQHPEILVINKEVTQKGLHEKSLRIAFRTDGDSQMGMGHVFRCLHLARTFQNAFHLGIIFLVKKSTVAKEFIQKQGYPLISISEHFSEVEEVDFIASILLEKKIDCLIIDQKIPPSQQYFRSLKTISPTKLVVMDKITNFPEVNVTILPTAHVDQKKIIPESQERTFFGIEYAVFSDELLKRKKTHLNPTVKNILISMGGSDPSRITLRILSYLRKMKQETPDQFNQFEWHVVIGPAFDFIHEIKTFMNENQLPLKIHEGITDLSPLLEQADLCVVSFGITPYEALAVRVPALVVSHDQPNYTDSLIFEKLNTCINLGYYENLTYERFNKELFEMIGNRELRERIFERDKDLIRGNGKEAIAKLIRGIL